MAIRDDNLLLGFYGDDFTGSTDVMEVLTRAGAPTVLFLEPPDAGVLTRFPEIRAVGVAGVSRSLPTEDMEAELGPSLSWLRELNPPLVHYKICSTFDSSPETGSIGRAIEIGQALFASPFVPLLAGAPRLGRYCVFGNLFARSGPETEPFRLDRHPTMRRHPVTPMDESDLRIHLAKQTNKSIALFDIRHIGLPGDQANQQFDMLRKSAQEIVLFDVLYDSQLSVIGKLIWSHARGESPLFTVGSSGIEYALTAHWRESGLIGDPVEFAGAGAVDQIAVVSGSCSPVARAQIAWALDNGFAEVILQLPLLGDVATATGEESRAVNAALAVHKTGRSVIVHTGTGQSGASAAVNFDTGPVLGQALGRILQGILTQSGLNRAVIAGGDTCGYAARALGITALEMFAPMAPGGPICRVYAPGKPADGRQILFKGGQVGRIELYGDVLRGEPG